MTTGIYPTEAHAQAIAFALAQSDSAALRWLDTEGPSFTFRVQPARAGFAVVAYDADGDLICAMPPLALPDGAPFAATVYG